MQKMNLLYNKPSYFSFLSGILMSLSINIFYGIFSITPLPSNWKYLLLIACLVSASAFLFINIVVILEKRIENCKKDAAIKNVAETLETTYERLYPKTYSKLKGKFYTAIGLALFGLALLIWPHF